ncbi:hypothetical protein DOU17_14870 [Clavibacter michiganensis subsp. michiganensis]|nr:hypothetical protein [Clavibacter michiganensis subsp. michiganensis]
MARTHGPQLTRAQLLLRQGLLVARGVAVVARGSSVARPELVAVARRPSATASGVTATAIPATVL